ncbi:ParB/RepB/Spo0J family partition protein [Legionella drancourtii]|uniref:ParB/Sulfiredoxin domain-containing protein n=1 Tax=Legionella drancourtii LLAP12 TaxID=658187 RepID=G9EQF0_9GAMM|nr:ParB/RepB/Spo0J family partition protein [Legionella drancourtii]EHL30545.1 hypothetical protein LDG_7497 [Legionella drancourtii LLAP12]
MKKIKLNAKSLNLENGSNSKSSTITRAGITADLRFTRGKQLVEHSPYTLIPDPFNPRPGDQIDEEWLKTNLALNTESSLCKLDLNGNYIIPSFSELSGTLSLDLEEHYEFLRSLAYSIRNDGLIEPIEIFLADSTTDPEYFIDSDLDYGYVILEGHQRRLAGMLSGVQTLTCIEITDETLLARLKVNHRKLRRQLSENNLRKELTVGQNFSIVRELLKSEDCKNISNKELSSIIGLNEDIAGALKRLSLDPNKYPSEMINLIEMSQVSFRWIRKWISKSYSQIEAELERMSTGNDRSLIIHVEKSKPLARGKNGGTKKRSATFKVKLEQDSIILKDYLLKMIPDLIHVEDNLTPFHSLENLLNKLLDLAKSS